MKKTALLVACVALTCSSAVLAQAHDEGRAMHDADTTRSAPDTTRHSESKLGQTMHRLGEKTRSAMHRMGRSLHARRDNTDTTRAMGADADRERDVAQERRDRMDRAYADWKSRQPDAATGRTEPYSPHEDRVENGAPAR